MKRAVFPVAVAILLCVFALIIHRRTAQIDKLKSQVSRYKESRENMCSRLAFIFEGTAAVAKQSPPSQDADRQRLRTDLLVIGAQVEGCVRIPDSTQKAMEGLFRPEGPKDDDLKEGVIALYTAIRIAQMNEWPLR